VNYNQKELELTKLRYNLNKKYNYEFEFPKEMFEFQKANPTEQYEKNNKDNLPTHANEAQKQFYSANSKLFKNTPLDITDSKSIQYCPSNRVFLLVKDRNL
jgi:hypothetical protein